MKRANQEKLQKLYLKKLDFYVLRIMGIRHHIVVLKLRI